MLFFLLNNVLLFFLSHLCLGEWINLELSVDNPNFYDGSLRAFSKHSPSAFLFGYSNDTACTVERVRNVNRLYQSDAMWDITLTDIDTFMRNGRTTIELTPNAIPLACFKNGPHNFIIFNLRNEQNEVVVVRGGHQKVARELAAYGRILFDHVDARLYMVDRSERRINELFIPDLERWWWLNNTAEKDNRDSPVRRLRYHTVGFLPEQKTDYFFVANHVYMIWRRRVYKFRIGDYMVDRPAEEQLHFLTNSSDNRFNYLLFHEKDRGGGGAVFGRDARDASSVAAATAAVAVPSHPNGVEKLLFAFTYLLDMVVLLIAICAIRQFRRSWNAATTVNRNDGDGAEMMKLNDYDLIHSMTLLNGAGGGAYHPVASVYNNPTTTTITAASLETEKGCARSTI